MVHSDRGDLLEEEQEASVPPVQELPKRMALSFVLIAKSTQVLVSNNRATGVVLSNGDVINARRIVSNLDPRRTLMGLVGESHLPENVVASLARFKFRGSSGKVNLALDGLPDFTCRPGIGDHLRGDIAIAPNVDYLERAFDEAKYGSFSSRPFINVVIPSLTDPTVAPPGKHVMSCFVQYAPYELKGRCRSLGISTRGFWKCRPGYT